MGSQWNQEGVTEPDAPVGWDGGSAKSSAGDPSADGKSEMRSDCCMWSLAQIGPWSRIVSFLTLPGWIPCPANEVR
jgi:hypothetical protein